MLLGENVHYQSTNAVYTPPMSRGGESAVFAVDVIQASLSGTTTSSLTIDIEHKNLSDTAWSVTAASFDAITTTGMQKKEVSGLKEQVRLKCLVSGGNADWARIYILPVSWMP